VDFGGARVQTVFQEFLDGGSGALHHLASGDLVDEMVGKQPDGGHGVGGMETNG
jgi:hypothetical protein